MQHLHLVFNQQNCQVLSTIESRHQQYPALTKKEKKKGWSEVHLGCQRERQNADKMRMLVSCRLGLFHELVWFGIPCELRKRGPTGFPANRGQSRSPCGCRVVVVPLRVTAASDHEAPRGKVTHRGEQCVQHGQANTLIDNSGSHTFTFCTVVQLCLVVMGTNHPQGRLDAVSKIIERS